MRELIAAARLENSNGRRGAGHQFRGWTHRTRHQVAATIRTETAEFGLSTLATECAFEGADHRFGRFRWKILVAALAVGAQFKHDNLRIEKKSDPLGRG